MRKIITKMLIEKFRGWGMPLVITRSKQGRELQRWYEDFMDKIADDILSLIPPQPKMNEQKIREIIENNVTIPVIEWDDDGNKTQIGKELNFDKAVSQLSKLSICKTGGEE